MDSIGHWSSVAQEILFNPKHSLWLSLVLLSADALLTAIIVKKIPYTEIDWTAYMQQIETYRSGERDYAKIKGQTEGPLVYPAGHVYVYDALYSLTQQGTDIFGGQCIFVALYLGTLSVVMACYRRAKAPPYLLTLLVLSKRLHSIFVLRLFNDCFSVFGLFSSIYFLQAGYFLFGSMAFALAVSIKMSVLLAVPGLAITLLQALPPKRALNMAMIMLQLHILLAVPFLSANAKSYLSRAFDLSRQFLFEWTVNWKFVGEEIFLSRIFAIGVLIANMLLLLLFLFTRWTEPSALTPLDLVRKLLPSRSLNIEQPLGNVTAEFTMTTILTSLIIGLLCARTLHYQFFAYIAWSTPLLLWKSGLPAFLVVLVWFVQEIAWNVYPSNEFSSMIVVGCLAVQLVGVWTGTGRRPSVNNKSATRRDRGIDSTTH